MSVLHKIVLEIQWSVHTSSRSDTSCNFSVTYGRTQTGLFCDPRDLCNLPSSCPLWEPGSSGSWSSRPVPCTLGPAPCALCWGNSRVSSPHLLLSEQSHSHPVVLHCFGSPQHCPQRFYMLTLLLCTRRGSLFCSPCAVFLGRAARSQRSSSRGAGEPSSRCPLLSRAFCAYTSLKLRICRARTRIWGDLSRESQTPTELFELATRSSKARSSKRTLVQSGTRCTR